MMSHSQNRSIFDSAPHPAVVISSESPSFRVLDVNTAFIQLVDVNREDLLGMSLPKLYQIHSNEKKTTAGLLHSLNKVLEKKEELKMETGEFGLTLEISGSGDIYGNPVNTPVLTEQGDVDCILHTLSDITETVLLKRRNSSIQKQLSASKEKHKTLIHSLNGIVWESDARTFQMRYISPQTEDILGYPPELWYADPAFWEKNIHPDDREKAIRYCRLKTEEGEDHQFEYRFMTAGGRTVWLRDIISVIKDEDTPLLLRGLMLDITEEKLSGEQKNEALSKLQERVKEQSCLYRISSLNEQEFSVREFLSSAVSILPDGWQYPGIAAASIEYDGAIYKTNNYRESEWGLTSCAKDRREKILTAHVVYLEERPELNEGPFQKEERNLLDTIAKQLALKIDHIQTLKTLHEKQKLLNKTYELANIGDWTYDLIADDLYWSPVTKKVHGFDQDYEPDIENTIHLFKEGEDRETFAKAVEEALNDGKPFDHELRIISGEGDERWIRATGEPEFRDGECVRFYGISQNIHERKQAEEDLKLSEQRFRALVQDGSDLIAILDPEANYTYVSPSSESILGIPAENFIGTNVLDYTHKDDRERILEILSDLPEDRRIQLIPFRFKNGEGNWRWVETIITNMLEDPAVGGFVANSRDVTEQIERERKLQQLSLVASKTTDIVVITDPSDRIRWVNDAFVKLTGFTLEECAGKKPGRLLQGPHTDTGTRERLRKAVQDQVSITEEILNYTKDGRTYWLNMTVDPVFDENGICTDFIAIERNITRQKKEERQLLESLKEKETLLAEIHHRVKNNLAVVSGMLQLQSGIEDNKEVNDRLIDSVARIKTMANIHEQLYNSNSFTRLDFSENVKTLISSIVKTFEPETHIDVHYRCSPIQLNINQAIPCSLIINEVVTNILKHAFPGIERGKITLHLTENHDNGCIELKVIDNGVGLPVDFSVENSSSLGLNLINVLSRQLKAEYWYDSAEGETTFTIHFDKADLKGIGSSFID